MQKLLTSLATDPALLDRVPAQERRRAGLILDGLMPISRKGDDLRNDGFRAATPSPTAVEQITVPTLILPCEDDLFGTAGTARLLVGCTPNPRLRVYPDGGHIWLGHDDELTEEIARFVNDPQINRQTEG